MTALFWVLVGAWAAEPAALKARVTDEAGFLSPSAERMIERFSEDLEKASRVQLAVLTVEDLGGRSVEEFGLKVAELTGLGQKKSDNGVLLLVAKAERAVRIEVGYGLEGVLPDVLSSRIIRNQMVPEFRAGRFDQGILRAVQAIGDRVRDPSQAVGNEAEATRGALPRLPVFLLWLIFVAVIIVLRVMRPADWRRMTGKRWSGPGGWHGGGGGFGGFGGLGGGGGGFGGGGGGFGGGGASGRW